MIGGSILVQYTKLRISISYMHCDYLSDIDGMRHSSHNPTNAITFAKRQKQAKDPAIHTYLSEVFPVVTPQGKGKGMHLPTATEHQLK